MQCTLESQNYKTKAKKTQAPSTVYMKQRFASTAFHVLERHNEYFRINSKI